MTDPAPAPEALGQKLLDGLKEAAPVIETLVTAFVPGGQIVAAGLTVTQLFTIASGLLAAEPEIVGFWQSFQNWMKGGPPPTAAQWAAIDAGYDAQSARLAAADAAVIAGKPAT